MNVLKDTTLWIGFGIGFGLGYLLGIMDLRKYIKKNEVKPQYDLLYKTLLRPRPPPIKTDDTRLLNSVPESRTIEIHSDSKVIELNNKKDKSSHASTEHHAVIYIS